LDIYRYIYLIETIKTFEFGLWFKWRALNCKQRVFGYVYAEIS